MNKLILKCLKETQLLKSSNVFREVWIPKEKVRSYGII